MESRTNYTIVGLVVLILGACLLATALWLSVGFGQKSYNTYAVYMHEAVSGLSEESPVKFNGVQVGSVKKIELNDNDPQQVRILLNIAEGTPITTSTHATLISQGITGVSFVGLSADSSELTPLKKLPGNKYPIIPAKPSLFNQLDRVLKEVAEDVSDVSVEIRRVFDKENARYIKDTLANMQQFTDAIAKNSANINDSLKHADIFLENIARVSRDLPEIMQELKVGVHRFNDMAINVSQAGEAATKAMKAGKNTIDNFSNQVIPPAIILLRQLDRIAANLESVSVKMKHNPAVLIRGTTPIPPGPGE